MRRDRRLMKQSFGVNEWNLADLPVKSSNLRLAWVLHTLLSGFSSGQEIPSRQDKRDFRSWRFYRHRQVRLQPLSHTEEKAEA